MQYRNKFTGAVIDVPSEIGGPWEPAGVRKAPATPAPVKEKAPAKKTTRKTTKK